MLRNVVNQLRITDSRRINGYLIRPGVQPTVYLTQFVDSSTYRKRNIDIGCNPLYQFSKSLTPFVTGCDIKKSQFICSLLAISTPQLDRITGLAEIDKVSSLYGLSVFDIQTRYNSFC